MVVQKLSETSKKAIVKGARLGHTLNLDRSASILDTHSQAVTLLPAHLYKYNLSISLTYFLT